MLLIGFEKYSYFLLPSTVILLWLFYGVARYNLQHDLISFVLSSEKQSKESLDPTTKLFVGVTFFILSSAVSSLGLNMQALALQGQRERNEARAQELAREEELAAQMDSEFDDFSSDYSENSGFLDDEVTNSENDLFVARKYPSENEKAPLLDSNLANSESKLSNCLTPQYGTISNLEPLETTKNNGVVNATSFQTSTSRAIDIIIPSSSLIPSKSPSIGLSSSLGSQKTPTFERSPTAHRILDIRSQAGSPGSPNNRTRIRRDQPVDTEAEQLRKAKERMDLWKDFFLKWQWYLVFGSVVALIFISPMVLAPLGSSGLIFNVLFSSFFLGTQITSFDWFGTLLIVFGCSLVSIFGDQGNDDKQTIDELLRLFSRSIFIFYFAIQNSFAILVFILVKYLESSKLDTTPTASNDATPQTPIIIHDRIQDVTSVSLIQTESPVSLLSSSVNSFSQNADMVSNTHTHTPRYRKASARSQRNSHAHSHPATESLSQSFLRKASVILFGPRDSSASYSSSREGRSIVRWARTVRGMIGSWLFSNIGTMFAVVGGIMASETLLLTKSGISFRVELLLESLIDSNNQFNVSTIYLQLYCLNRALYHSHPVVAIPLFFTVFTCCTLVGSVVYFDAFAKFSPLALFGVALGLGSIVGGVWLLRESQAHGHDVQKKIEEEAAAAALIAEQ
ncbi:hypothetical protein HK096_005101, partial [Nowakowskiella sp. JEL0078]